MNRLRQSWINVDIFEAAQTFGHEPAKISDIYIYYVYIYNCIHIYIYVTAYIYIYAAYIYIYWCWYTDTWGYSTKNWITSDSSQVFFPREFWVVPYQRCESSWPWPALKIIRVDLQPQRLDVFTQFHLGQTRFGSTVCIVLSIFCIVCIFRSKYCGISEIGVFCCCFVADDLR